MLTEEEEKEEECVKKEGRKTERFSVQRKGKKVDDTEMRGEKEEKVCRTSLNLEIPFILMPSLFLSRKLSGCLCCKQCHEYSLWVLRFVYIHSNTLPTIHVIHNTFFIVLCSVRMSGWIIFCQVEKYKKGVLIREGRM